MYALKTAVDSYMSSPPPEDHQNNVFFSLHETDMLSFKDPPFFGIHILSTAAATVSLKQKTKDDNTLHSEMCHNIFCGISHSQ